MAVSTGIDIIKQIAELVNKYIEKNEKLNIEMEEQENLFNQNLQQILTEIRLIEDKLNSYHELNPIVVQVKELENRSDNLVTTLNLMKTNLISCQSSYEKFISERDTYTKLSCIFKVIYNCKNSKSNYTRKKFIKAIKDINDKIQNQLKTIITDFNHLTDVMNSYKQDFENLKFDFIPLRHLWIVHKWSYDETQIRESATIQNFTYILQSKYDEECGLSSNHYNNMREFLKKMVTFGKNNDELKALHRGSTCGTYCISDSLMANLTNSASKKLNWIDLSDLVIYLSLNILETPTDDKVSLKIILRYNEETELKKIHQDPEMKRIYYEELEKNKKKHSETDELNKQTQKLSIQIKSSINDNIVKDLQTLEDLIPYLHYTGTGHILQYATFNTNDGIFRLNENRSYTIKIYLYLRNFTYWNNIYLEHYKEDNTLLERHCIKDVVQDWEYRGTTTHKIKASKNDYLRIRISGLDNEIKWHGESSIIITKDYWFDYNEVG